MRRDRSGTGRRAAGLARRAMVWAALAGLVAWSLFPFWWAAALSLKGPLNGWDATIVPFLQFPPTGEHWAAEREAFFAADGLGGALLNGTVVGLAVAGLCLVLGTLAAVGLLRVRRAGGRGGAILGLVLLPRLLPPIALGVPLWLLGRASGLQDTLAGLTLAQSVLALPLAVVVLQSAVREVPFDLVEAAQLDGAGWLRTTREVLLPLLGPALVATAVLCFATSWNEYLFAVLNHGQHAVTPPVSVMLLEDRDGIPFPHVGSHLVLIIVPPVLLTLLAQRHVVRGLTMGAVTG